MIMEKALAPEERARECSSRVTCHRTGGDDIYLVKNNAKMFTSTMSVQSDPFNLRGQKVNATEGENKILYKVCMPEALN